MPKGTPDEGIYRPEVNPGDVLPRKILPELRGISIGPGVEALGNTLQNKFEADTNTYAGNALANLRVGMDATLEQAKANAKPGAEGYTQDVLKTFDDQAKQYTTDGGANPFVSRLMAPHLATLRTQVASQAIQYESQAGIQYRAQSARDTVDKLATVAAAHPEQAQDLTAQALRQVGGSRLDPDVTLATARYAQSAINVSAVNARIQADPYATMTALLKPETADATIQALTPSERETLLSRSDAMLHQRVSDAERVSVMQDKQDREAATSALSGLITQSTKGPVTMADVQKVAPLFRNDPSGLEAAIRLTEVRDKIETDPRLFVQLTRMQNAGQDVTDVAASHVGRDLSKEDFAHFASVADRGLPNAVKQGEDTINGVFKQGLMDKYDPAFNQRHMNALNDFYDWTRANPNATPDQSVRQANSITHSYSLNTYSHFVQTAPAPRFAVGGRFSYDPDKTEAAIFAAESKGAISHADAIQQMGIAAHWREVVERFGGKTPFGDQAAK